MSSNVMEYTIVKIEESCYDVFLNGKKIGQWIGRGFYPEKNYKCVPITLMKFLLLHELEKA